MHFETYYAEREIAVRTREARAERERDALARIARGTEQSGGSSWFSSATNNVGRIVEYSSNAIRAFVGGPVEPSQECC